MSASLAHNIDLRDPSTRNLSPPLLSQSLHRRISLQSPLDFIYLRNRALRTAREKIDLNLPPDVALHHVNGDGDGDTMRRIVERDVADYVNRIFEDVKRNIDINGIAGEKLSGINEGDNVPGEDFEAFDTRLADTISSLHAQIETLHVELATIRRIAVRDSTEEYKTELRSYFAQLEAKEAKDESLQHANDDGEVQDSAFWALNLGGREDTLHKSWEEILASLNRFRNGGDSDVNATKLKSERAQEVARHLEGG